MAADHWQIELLAAGMLGVSLLIARYGEPAPRPTLPPRATLSAPVNPPAFPPPRAGPRATPQRPAAARQDALAEITALGAHPRPDPSAERSAYLRAPDLYRYAMTLLPRAEAGDAASQYYLYLALDQCVLYLRLDAYGAQAMHERMLLELGGRSVDERELWFADDRACRPFAGADLRPIEAAMGARKPGAEVEYPSVWFERAVQSGFPLAQAERALRDSALDAAARLAMLQSAVRAGDPEAAWLVARRLIDENGGGASVDGVAWLIAACRAGMDCSAQARWFRAQRCAHPQWSCGAGESAIEHYWYALPAHERERAHARAADIERGLRDGTLDALPWPRLEGIRGS